MSTGRLTTRRTIDAVEAAYVLEGSHEQWLASLLEAVHRDIDLGAGIYSFTARVTPAGFAPDSAFASRALDPAFVALLARLNRTPPRELLDELAQGLVHAGSLEALLGARHPVTRHFRATARGTGFVDGFTMFAQDGEGGGVCLSAPARFVAHHREEGLAIWRQAGLHFAAALRLRRNLARGVLPCEAIITPGGRVADARGAVRDEPELRARLRAAVADVEKARTNAVRRDPERALNLWQGLVEGRWSLVDRWESDGRRYVVAHANAPAQRDFRALDERERVTLRYVALGASNKEIAFTLGLPVGSVATCVRRVVRKLGGRSRRDLVGIEHADALQVELGADSVGVLRSRRAADSALAALLTPGEREVLELVVEGVGNADIARSRSRSIKTVANQVSSIFAKLGVQSRTEAIAKILGAGASPTARARR